jgi:hypothetical protein
MILVEADFRTGTAMFSDLVLQTSQASSSTLTAAILGAQQVVQTYCDDQFDSGATAQTRLVDGADANLGRLLLPWRIQDGSVTLVETLDTSGLAQVVHSSLYRVNASLNSTGDDFGIYRVDEVRRIGTQGYWPSGSGNIRITAKFGWAVAPFAVKRSMALIVFDLCSGKNTGEMRAASWSTPSATYTRAADVFMGIPEANDLLATYRFERDRIGAV